jgi:DedD protein
MAFFKFRLPGQAAGESQGNLSNTPAESVEVMRRRARHRLIGASVLVLVGVIVFPLLFDTQPRPVSVDIAVDIPDRANSKPMVDTSTKAKPLSAAAGLDPKEEVVAPEKPEPVVVAKAPEVKQAEAKQAEAKQADVKPADAKPVEAKVAEVKTTETKADSAGRFIVQVGAFSEEAKANDVRAKIEKAGFKTYTQVATTKEGPRTRVRVGPFASRDEADKAARKIKQLQLQPQVLTL